MRPAVKLHLTSWLFFAAAIFFPGLQQCIAQHNTEEDRASRIRLVESGLASNIRIDGDSTWTLAQRMKHHNTPSVSIAVIRNFELDWAKAYGVADKTTGRLADTSTLYQAASISKSLNGVGALLLVQEKKADLHADINDLLQSWKFPYDSLSANSKIALAQLLSHTAGLTVHGFPGYNTAISIPTLVQVINGDTPANTLAIRSQFAPGTKVQYSGGGTTISQLIITDLTKLPYSDYMKSRVLEPLGMSHSTFQQPPPANLVSKLATGHRASGQEITGKFHVYPEQAAAGLWTNPTDLAKYIIETQLAYHGKSSKVLNPEMTRVRLTPVMDGAALGVFIMEKGGAKYFTHGGANEGFRCQYFGDLENGNGVVVMVNSDNGAIMNEIINSVATVYNWKDFYNPKIYKKAVVKDSVLQQYVGEYQLPAIQLTISRKEGQLYAKPAGQAELAIFPESEKRFFLTEVDAQLEFVKSDNGIVEKLVLFQNGKEFEAKKIK